MPVWKLYSRQSSISEASTCQRDLLLLSERYAACALHGNVSAVRLCGVCAVSIEAFVVIGGGILLFFEAEFDPYCIAKPKRLGFALPVVFLANQSIVWFLTWYGKFLLSRKLHPFGNPEVHQMISFLSPLLRDNSIVISVATLGFALAVPTTATTGIQTHIVYPWTMTGVSCLCCHLILNLFRVERDPLPFELSNPNLETISNQLESDHIFPPPVYLRRTQDVPMETEGPLSLPMSTLASRNVEGV
ncbi:hypothetical protein AGABI2DRAFT_121422 [Agaricus bisporus var. bisporus H97]|uniref:hypothetical protein n=1 Tax=Agaricus bisporus var. bisporus (strain H97 / ATCC MYA-4626 / FGSC 10389) TaxID=936046 RepID=UPI00029F53ED|nr:hypothetical protein AGABI2DRAFT_121422 [Agaricus bisporus var. bisporus H97]EKV44243.1 hypothetical protein AGABI2DRAFT_121422 [Agaricus bisporus var. bisporus H97]